MDLLVRKVYGRTSEKVDPQQLPLFEKQGEMADDEVIRAAGPESEPPVAPSRKRGHGRRPKPDTLERRELIHDLGEAEKRALAGDGELVPIGEEITEQYEWEPSCLYVLRHVQKKYARRPMRLESGPSAAEKNMITAPKPPQPIPGSSAGPGLLAYLVTSRFCDHLPYHRQERIFQRHGLRFSRQTTCDWARQLAELCRPLYELMRAEVLASAVLHADDTPVKVRDAHAKRQYLGRFWNYVGDRRHPLTVFDLHARSVARWSGGVLERLSRLSASRCLQRLRSDLQPTRAARSSKWPAGLMCDASSSTPARATGCVPRRRWPTSGNCTRSNASCANELEKEWRELPSGRAGGADRAGASSTGAARLEAVRRLAGCRVAAVVAQGALAAGDSSTRVTSGRRWNATATTAAWRSTTTPPSGRSAASLWDARIGYSAAAIAAATRRPCISA